jgi:hypothetical protein
MLAAPVSVDNVAAMLVDMLDLSGCWFEPFPFDVQLPRIEPGRIVLPANEPVVGPCQVNRGVELPLRCNGLTLGRFVLAPRKPTVGVALPSNAREEAIRLADEFATTLAASWCGAGSADLLLGSPQFSSDEDPGP